MRAMYLQGKSYRSIRAMLGISPSGISAEKYGVTVVLLAAVPVRRRHNRRQSNVVSAKGKH
ncbi:MAG: hypothetical protein LC116_02940 [Bacteroidetes bacterium]|nr:hypothetical protein [Bacteroidota bacterium]